METDNIIKFKLGLQNILFELPSKYKFEKEELKLALIDIQKKLDCFHLNTTKVRSNSIESNRKDSLLTKDTEASKEDTSLISRLEKSNCSSPPSFRKSSLPQSIHLSYETKILASMSSSKLNIEKYWSLIKKYCDPSKPSKIIEIALDTLEKLICSRLINGNIFLPAQTLNGENSGSSSSSDDHLKKDRKRLIDDIVESISFCLNHNKVSQLPNENIQIQIIKAYTKLFWDNYYEIHQFSIEIILKTCHRIYLYSKSNSISDAASAASVQMLNQVFNRMENWFSIFKQAKNLEYKDLEDPSNMQNMLSSPSSTETSNNSYKSAEEIYDTMPEYYALIECGYFGYCHQCFAPAYYWNTATNLPVCDPFSDSYNVLHSSKSHGSFISYINESLLLPHFNKVKLFRCKAYAMHFEILREDSINALELLFDILRADTSKFLNHRHNISNHLLSLQDKSKKFCLYLICCILNASGDAFMQDEVIKDLLKHQLCLALSSHGLESNIEILEINIAIFLSLLNSFRCPLKTQLEVLFNEIYLHMLEMPSTTSYAIGQKIKILQGLQKICSSPQLLLDLYINYDCDISMESLFEKMVLIFASLCDYVRFFQQIQENEPLATIEKNDNHVESTHIERATAITSISLTSIMNYFETLLVEEITKEKKLSKTINYELKYHIIVCFLATIKSLSSWLLDIKESCLMNDQKFEFSNKLSSPKMSNILVASKHPISCIQFPLIHMNTYDIDKNKDNKEPILNTNTAPEGEDLNTITENKTRKQHLRHGIYLFNTSKRSMDGIDYLTNHGFIEKHSLPNIVQFLLNTHGIEKSSLGNFLGESSPECISTMHSFIDALDFRNYDIISALRALLSRFKLPGEAQKIDRIMEKFADRYCECNPNVFPKADVAYTLAFSIIILNTDLHSNQIKNKMSKESYIKSNRNVHSEGSNEVSDALLSDIYNSIAKEELLLDESNYYFKNTAESVFYHGIVTESKYKYPMHQMTTNANEFTGTENIRMKIKSEALFKEVRPFASFKTATKTDHVKPMVEVLIYPLLGSLIMTYEQTDNISEKNKELIKDTLACFYETISILISLKMELEKNLFIIALTELAHRILQVLNTTAMKIKSIWSLKTLLNVVLNFGNFIGEFGWLQFCKLISNLDKFGLIESPIENLNASHSRQDSVSSTSSSTTKPETLSTPNRFLPNRYSNENYVSSTYLERPNSKTNYNFTNFFSKRKHDKKENFRLQMAFQENEIPRLVENIYINSVYLEGSAILSFFHALCQISSYELSCISENTKLLPLNSSNTTSDNNAPRIYSLQKIVEVAYYNMGRIRLEWTQIWKVLQPHFNYAGLHSNVQVCRLSIDSLRQLCLKFLERDELAHYHTQTELFKSFEYIFQKNPGLEVKELIMSSLNQLIILKAKNIKSGWKTILSLLCEASQYASLHTVLNSLMRIIIEDCFDYILFNHCYLEFIITLKVFTLACAQKTPNLATKTLNEFGCIHKKIETYEYDILYSWLESSNLNAASNYNILTKFYAEIYNIMRYIVIKADIVELFGPELPSLGLNKEKTTSKRIFYYFYFPLLCSLSDLIKNIELPVNLKLVSSEIYFKCLLRASDKNLFIDWKAIYLVNILPFFPNTLEKKADEIIIEHNHNAKNEKIDPIIDQFNTGALFSSEMIHLWYEILTHWVKLIILSPLPLLEAPYLEIFLLVLKYCIFISSEKFSDSFVDLMYQFISKAEKTLALGSWTQISYTFIELLDNSFPRELVSEDFENQKIFNIKSFDDITLKCSIHLKLLNLLERLRSLFTPSFTKVFFQSSHIFYSLIQSLNRSHNLSRSFNNNLPLRTYMYQNFSGYSSINGIILRKQEIKSMKVMIELLFCSLKYHYQPGSSSGHGSWSDDEVLDRTLIPLKENLLYSINFVYYNMNELCLVDSSNNASTLLRYLKDLEVWIPLVYEIYEEFKELSFLYHERDDNSASDTFSYYVKTLLKDLSDKAFLYLSLKPKCRLLEEMGDDAIQEAVEQWSLVRKLFEDLNYLMVQFVRKIQSHFLNI